MCVCVGECECVCVCVCVGECECVCAWVSVSALFVRGCDRADVQASEQKCV